MEPTEGEMTIFPPSGILIYRGGWRPEGFLGGLDLKDEAGGDRGELDTARFIHMEASRLER